ncbi:MAG: HAMP domain-containing sensor histidine kinase [Arcobacteraceae bacterium]
MIQKLYRLSIKTKITLSFFFIIILFSSGVLFIIKNSLSDKINTLASNTAKDIITVNEAFFIKSLLEDDVWSIYKFLHSLTKINLIESAGFIDTTNTIIAHTNTQKYPLDTKIDIQRNKNFVSIPLVSHSLNLGVFIIELNKNSFTQFFEELKTHLIISIFFATLFSFFVAYFISNRILHRLEILSHNATKIQEKKWDELKTISFKEEDEITLFQNSMELILTKLHQAIENEHNLREFYHDILESLDELIILCDTSYALLYENGNLLNSLVIENNILNSKIQEQITLHLENGTNNFMIDIENQHHKTIYLFVLIKKLDNSLAISISDITLLKQLQEKQCFTNSFEIVGEISSSVVHEIKNYLQPAKLLIDQEDIDAEDKKRMGNIITKIDLLVNEFLKTGKPIDKLLAVDIDIKEEFNYVSELLQTQLKAKKLHIQKSIPNKSTLFMAHQDFETIMLNLLENAIDESFEEGTIFIEVSFKQLYTVIDITDLGKGIDKAILKDIYKPFFTTKGEKGSGIGLYSTYKIVYMYHGYIDVHSNKGKTTFSIHIPKKGSQ